MKVKIKKLHPDAKVPTYGTDMASGFDLSSVEELLIIGPGNKAIVPTGLSVEIPKGFEIQIRPRSGLAAKYGVTVLNTPGTVDADYRGEIRVILINHGEDSFIVRLGDRIAQGVLAMVTDQAEFEEVEDFNNTTARGEGGFGSTGVN